MMCGYMLLAGDQGVAWIVEHRLHADALSLQERYLALCALRALQAEAPKRLSRDALCRAVRPLLDRPDFADIAVSDLARLKDWEVQDKLIAIYKHPEDYELPSVMRRVITSYLSASAEDVPAGAAELPEHARMAREFLATIARSR
jgi:hypothetical protein